MNISKYKWELSDQYNFNYSLVEMFFVLYKLYEYSGCIKTIVTLVVSSNDTFNNQEVLLIKWNLIVNRGCPSITSCPRVS